MHDCDIPLNLVKDRYCLVHKQQDLICVVTTCSEPAEEGHRTCNIEDHRALENYNDLQTKALFQLKLRLSRLKVSQPRDSMPEIPATSDTAPAPVLDDEEVMIDSAGVCEGKPEEGNKTLRARFGRKRTHNEELCVASCGVILGRATFYGSEAPNGVRVSGFLLHKLMSSLCSNLDFLEDALSNEEISSWRPLARQQLPHHGHAQCGERYIFLNFSTPCRCFSF